MLSIIIPTLNEEKYLPLLLDSLKQQEFSDYEIIVSDGGSSDKTLDIAKQYGCQIVIDNEHHHPSWQRNNGAAMANGDILLFLDADIILQPNFLTDTVTEFKKNKLVGAGFYMKFNPATPLYDFYSGLFNFFCFFRQYFAPAAVGGGIMVKREIHKDIQGFDLKIYVAEDFDYCYRISRIGKFRMINLYPLLMSSRRLEKEGGIIVGLKWGVMSLFTLFNFKIKKKIVKYDFGKY